MTRKLEDHSDAVHVPLLSRNRFLRNLIDTDTRDGDVCYADFFHTGDTLCLKLMYENGSYDLYDCVVP